MGLFGQTEIFFLRPMILGKLPYMDIERLYTTTVKYIYADFKEKSEQHLLDYRWGKTTKKEYDILIQNLQRSFKGRIVSIWEDLSSDEQIAFYLKSLAQEFLCQYLSEDQACAIIIIQDKLVVYHA